ncbi:hypothetical protein KVT40_001739 [Elsinoe batatas]|uniref:Uncharacterized protein n=1 Tax=Elsinoe batatas TaxID=2601811 RepID=A0A8K0PFB4_9PEZI|nr:hypothetical protein KVT40_001739 [Elsinoe batatas]
MSQNLMDTEPGGESDQYSSINTFNKPHATSTGQLQPQDPSSAAPSHSLDPSQTKSHQERGEQTAANIRYGQAISEQGMGGKTTTASGEAGQEGGYGGTSGRGQAGTGGGEGREREKQGYEGGREMREDIGA